MKLWIKEVSYVNHVRDPRRSGKTTVEYLRSTQVDELYEDEDGRVWAVFAGVDPTVVHITQCRYVVYDLEKQAKEAPPTKTAALHPAHEKKRPSKKSSSRAKPTKSKAE